MPDLPPREAVAAAAAASPVKEVADVETQIVHAGPSAEKAAVSKTKAETKPQVSLAYPPPPL